MIMLVAQSVSTNSHCLNSVLYVEAGLQPDGDLVDTVNGFSTLPAQPHPAEE